jgi:hypothetical protein
MGDRIPQRVAGIAGLVFVVALLVSTFALTPSGMPKVNDTALKWASFVSDHRGRLQVSTYVGGIGFVGLLFFSAALSNVFARIEGLLRGPSTLIVVGGASTVAVAALGGVLNAVLYFRTTPSSDLGVVRALVDGQSLAFTILAFPLAVLLAGGGISTLRNGVLPRWTGWLAIVAAIVSLVGGGTMATHGTFSEKGVFGGFEFGSFILLLVWVLASAVVLLVRGFRASETDAPTPAPPAVPTTA